MPLKIHNITQDEHQEGDKVVRILRGSFYLPFFREGASIGVPVDEFPEDPEPVLLAAIHKEMQTKPELKDMIRNAIAEENAYLVAQIRHHDEQKAVCLNRLKELEIAFL